MEKQNDSKHSPTVVNGIFSAILHTIYSIYVLFGILWYEPHNSITKRKFIFHMAGLRIVLYYYLKGAAVGFIKSQN